MLRRLFKHYQKRWGNEVRSFISGQASVQLHILAGTYREVTQCVTNLQPKNKTRIFGCLFLRPYNVDVVTVKYRILYTFLTVQFAEVEMFPKVVCKFRSFLVERQVCYSLSLTEISGTLRRSEEQANLTAPHYTRTSSSDDTQTFYQVCCSLIHSGIL